MALGYKGCRFSVSGLGFGTLWKDFVEHRSEMVKRLSSKPPKPKTLDLVSIPHPVMA